MESLANALTVIGFEPGKLIVLFLFIIVIYAACRVINGWLGALWIKKTNDEVVLYEKISELNNQSPKEAEWESLSKLKRHIEFTIERHTTRMDQIKRYVDIFRFTIIGIFSYFAVLFWQLAWGEIDLGSKEQVLLSITLFATLLIALLVSDLIRIIWVNAIFPRLKFFVGIHRIQRKSKKLAKKSKTNLGKIKKIEKTARDLMSNTSSVDFDDLSKETLVLLRRLISNQVEEEEKLRQNAIDRKIEVANLLDLKSYGFLTRISMQQIEASERVIIEVSEQTIETLKRTDNYLAK